MPQLCHRACLALSCRTHSGRGRNKGRLLCHLVSPHILLIHLQEEGEYLSLLQAEQAAHSALSLARGGSLSLPLAEGTALQIRTHVTGSVPALGRLQPRHGASACPGTSGVSFSSKPCFQLGLDAQIVPLLLEASS